MSNHAWLNRAGTNGCLAVFKAQHIIGIGWCATGDLSGKDINAIHGILSAPQPFAYKGVVLGNNKASLNMFVNKMQKGDLVLVPNGAEILTARIESDYFYDKTKVQDDCIHQRKVKWLKTIRRDDLPKNLRGSLRAQRTVADLSKYYPIIKALSEGEKVRDAEEIHDTGKDAAENTTTISYPLRPTVNVTLIVPNDITKEEAIRVGDFARTIHFAD